MRRSPAVAGQFYEGTAAGLRDQVGRYVVKDIPKESAVGVVSPHAGLMYSGHVAGAVYSSILFPKTFVILAPNHTGFGPHISLMASGEWKIPTGTFLIDDALGRRIREEAPFISEDAQAHMFEHSIEVQLPFISYFSDSVRIVPIIFTDSSLEECRAVGEGIARAVRDSGSGVTIVASSDMSHYVTDGAARTLDKLAIDRILDLDPEGLYRTVREERISMCGFIPSTVMLFAAKSLGAGGGRLVKYATSGEINGDYGRVVGYAGIIIK